ncbi:acyloxyacyl hydrolase [Hydrogenovibrio kuenenii]|uniref:acyloxyacyl hydrolase n=1 Tax=Hydrogenovibrio kuenenii TaxID=63658 RepID=UPI00046540E0|nr:acyloxyacyl hydrolase [Hydrogenovibrio kuenenii]
MFYYLRTNFNSLLFLSLLSIITPKAAYAEDSNNNLMNLAIWSAVASFGFACYNGQAPCSLNPELNTDKSTLSFDTGSDHSIKQNRIALGADWQNPLFENDSFSINGRWEINANEWHSTLKNPKNKSGWIIGLTPVFHYNWKLGSFTPYFEAGAGPQFISNITIENNYKSTQFQFGDILGLGISTKHFEIGYRYLHISNANIELPNPGTNFHNLHIGYKF